MLENNSIPYVNKIKYLSHNLQNKSINTIFNLDPVVSDIKTRNIVILSHFKFINFDSKINI